jgi:hypothetical protein
LMGLAETCAVLARIGAPVLLGGLYHSSGPHHRSKRRQRALVGCAWLAARPRTALVAARLSCLVWSGD